MDKSQLLDLVDKLKSIETKSNSSFRLENEFFRIIRFSESRFYKYRTLNDAGLLKIFILCILFIPVISFKILINILFVLIFPGKIPKINNKYIKFLFISHATINHNYKNYNDRFYGSLINYKTNSLHFVVYFNHLKPFQKLLSIRNQQAQTPYLLTKNLDLRSSLIEIYKIFKDGLMGFLKLLYLQNVRNRSEFALTLGSLYSQCGRRTVSNRFIYIQISNILKDSKVDNLVLTFEGHATEYLLKQCFKKYNENGSVFLYQHSPFSLGQFSALSHDLIKDSKILFSSPIVFKWFTKSKMPKTTTLFLVGSNKAVKNQKQIMKTTNTVLLAPEGSKHSIRQYIRLARILLENKDLNEIILRLHPDSYLSSITKCKLKILKRLQRIKISKVSLSDDLKVAKYCIYSASSVGVEAIYYKTIPIFYGTRLERIFTDPLFLGDDSQHNNIDSQTNKFINFSKFRDKSVLYYSNYNLKIINSLFN